MCTDLPVRRFIPKHTLHSTFNGGSRFIYSIRHICWSLWRLRDQSLCLTKYSFHRQWGCQCRPGRVNMSGIKQDKQITNPCRRRDDLKDFLALDILHFAWCSFNLVESRSSRAPLTPLPAWAARALQQYFKQFNHIVYLLHNITHRHPGAYWYGICATRHNML